LEFASALTIVQASASIGDLRKNNIACGRNLSFFLDKLIMRLRAGGTRQSLETDEELLTYASGDLQGCTDEAWVWTGSDTGANLNQASINGYGPERPNTSSGVQNSSSLSEREIQNWAGWDHIQRTLTQLLHDQQQQQGHNAGPPPPNLPPPYPQGPAQYPPPSQTPNQHLAPHQPPTPVHPSLSPSGSNSAAPNGGSSRISIQDIM
jgi:hypothetical protein